MRPSMIYYHVRAVFIFFGGVYHAKPQPYANV